MAEHINIEGMVAEAIAALKALGINVESDGKTVSYIGNCPTVQFTLPFWVCVDPLRDDSNWIVKAVQHYLFMPEPDIGERVLAMIVNGERRDSKIMVDAIDFEDRKFWGVADEGEKMGPFNFVDMGRTWRKL